MIISSLFLGRSGTYNILGMQVEFQSDQPGFHNLSDNPIGKLGDNLLSNRVFNILTMGYLHTFVHEMGHALTYKIVSGGSSQVEIQISTSQLSGVTIHHGKNLSPIQHSIYLLGGPLANVAFSISLIFAAFALSAYMTYSVAMAIAKVTSIWIFGEAFYAVDSLLKNNNGDFAKIARNGSLHLLISTATMVGVIALGFFATRRVM